MPPSRDALPAELEHPNANRIGSSALEVFGDEAKARSWMTAPRDILDDKSPQQLIETGDVDQQRRVLEVLIRIDYGVFSKKTPMRIFRMYRSARSTADYSGAMAAGGRWNPIGTPMPYTPSTCPCPAWKSWSISTQPGIRGCDRGPPLPSGCPRS